MRKVKEQKSTLPLDIVLKNKTPMSKCTQHQKKKKKDMSNLLYLFSFFATFTHIDLKKKKQRLHLQYCQGDARVRYNPPFRRTVI